MTKKSSAYEGLEFRKPWEQQPGESNNEYSYFIRFLELEPGPKRVFRRFAQKVGVSPDYIYQLVTKNNWRKRIALYDAARSGQLVKFQTDILQELQTKIVHEATEDYDRMRAILAAGLQRLEEAVASGEPFNVAEFERLVRARSALDGMARRTAMLPSSYMQSKTEKRETHEMYFLDPKRGPVPLADAAQEFRARLTDGRDDVVEGNYEETNEETGEED